jgi:hypothetical protein
VNKNLARLLQQATRHRAETTLIDLFNTLELDEKEGALSKVFLANRELSDLGLRLVPDIQQGDLETVRRVEMVEPLPFTEAEILDDLRRREADDLELKSSLLFDHVRAKTDPNATITQLRSEAVLYSALRSIAAFLNCAGGLLYVGVDDTGAILGIEYDLPCITDNKNRQNADQWELHLRSHVQDRFKEGKSINDYVSCALVPIGGKLVARVEIAPRSKMAFLLAKDVYHLYRRQGNRTVEVPIDLVEEFIEFRKGLLG